jgi:sugar-specific transcriptional regulator TrmB
MDHDSCVEHLVGLGLSHLESLVYVFLVSHSPATGYRVAQGTGKPTANTYKAIETLERKGLLIVEDDRKRLYRAIPYQEMLRELERGFQQRKKDAARELARIGPSGSDDRVYRLHSLGHVMERCRSMLERARQAVIVDAFPEPLEELGEDLSAVGSRGVDVRVKAYAPVTIQGVTITVDYRGDEALRRWPGQWLNVVADANEHLLACLTEDGAGVHQAIWSGSPYLSWIYHCGIASEIAMDDVANALAGRGRLADVRAVLARYRPEDERLLPGRLVLERHFGSDPRS